MPPKTDASSTSPNTSARTSVATGALTQEQLAGVASILSSALKVQVTEGK